MVGIKRWDNGNISNDSGEIEERNKLIIVNQNIQSLLQFQDNLKYLQVFKIILCIKNRNSFFIINKDKEKSNEIVEMSNSIINW